MRKTKTITVVIVVFLICVSTFSTLHADEVPVIPVESVELDREQVDLAIDHSVQLIATVLPEDATNPALLWTTARSRRLPTVW